MNINNKQIVLTSDTMPRYGAVRDRLRSRFPKLVTLQPWKIQILETRIAIFRSLLEREYKKNPLSASITDSINYVLQFRKMSRGLQGAFTKLIGTASIDQRLESI